MAQQKRIILQWTRTAKAHFATLPRKVRRGLLDQANLLREADDPTAVHKPLTGPLQGYYRIVYGRYRLIYTVDEAVLPNEERVIYVRILFVAAGIRKERDKRDVYKVAQRLIEFGLITMEPERASDQASADPPSDDSG